MCFWLLCQFWFFNVIGCNFPLIIEFTRFLFFFLKIIVEVKLNLSIFDILGFSLLCLLCPIIFSFVAARGVSGGGVWQRVSEC